MAALLLKLGRSSVKHRVLVVVVWVLALVAMGTGAATLAGPTGQTLSIPGQESSQALELINERFGGGASAQVVVGAPEGRTLLEPELTADVTALVAELEGLPGVAAVVNPLSSTPPTVSPSTEAAFATVTYSVAASDVTDEQRDALLDVAGERPSGLLVDVKGDATQTVVEILGPAEILGVVIAFGVLALTYGALAAAGMNLLTAVVGVGIGAGGITALSGFTELQSTTSVLAVMLGLAVGIDYALFIISRHRSELIRGATVDEAAAMAVGTAGSAVVTAGLTVVIALAGLSVAGIPFLVEMGLAAAATVVVAVLVALTLVPAALSFLGLRVLPKRARVERERATSERAARFYRGWGEGLTRRRVPVLVGAVLALGALSIPVLGMETSMVQPYEPGSTQDRASDVVAEQFGPGFNGPLVVLVEGPGGTAAARAAEIAAGAGALPDVAYVAPVVTDPLGANALVTVVPASGPTSPQTEELVGDLRDLVGDGSYVTGATAVSVDTAAQLREALALYLVLVVGLAFVLLVLVFRSLVVPLVGVLGFLLTTGATLGVTVMVFQLGWAKDLFGVSDAAPLLSIMPIIDVGILFGLAMDYQVFLVSRMHEAHRKGIAARDAVTTGFSAAAPVVVAAAAIMLAVFAGFIPVLDPGIKMIAFGLSVGIVLDAFVVRLLIVPSVLSLFGERAWQLPRFLRWIPELDVEGSKLTR